MPAALILFNNRPDFTQAINGYQFGDPLTSVFRLTGLPDGDPKAMAELAWAITNSYPSELHCPQEYLPQVIRYRVLRLRSLSVGDVVIVGEMALAVASGGYEPLDRIPEHTNALRGIDFLHGRA